MDDVFSVRVTGSTGTKPVGHLTWLKDKRRAVFAYSDENSPGLVPDGFSPPYGTLVPNLASDRAAEYFQGLHGVFNDSLPDGWGRLLLDRLLAREDILAGSLTPVQRLAFVGADGPGALSYHPADHRLIKVREEFRRDLDRLATECLEILSGHTTNALATLVSLAGSSSGARPKINTALDAAGRPVEAGHPWMVKFAARDVDSLSAGALEHIYAEMSRSAGIRMAETRILPSTTSIGWFASKRFDRAGNPDTFMHHIHMVSMSGLLELTHRMPTASYEDLMVAVLKATGNDTAERDEMFRRAVFNVLAHNKDDHVKNHALMRGEDGAWRLTPAYDVTFSTSMGNEHMCDLNRKGKPGIEDLMAYGRRFGVENPHRVIERTRDVLSTFPRLARGYGVPHDQISLVTANMPGLKADNGVNLAPQTDAGRPNPT